MTGGTAWLASLLLLPVAGLPLLSHRSFGVFPLPSRIVFSAAAGAALVSFAMTAQVLVGVPWRIGATVLLTAFLSFALRVFLPRPLPPAIPESSEGGRWAAAAHGLSLLAVLAAFAATRMGAASSPDLIFFWGPKAQQFAIARSFDAAYMGADLHHYMHSYYPPLVTNLAAFASMAAGRFSWTAAVMTFPLLLAALAIGLPGLLRAGLGRTGAAGLSALAVAAIGYLGMEADIAGNGEMPLLLFEALAAALLVSPAASGTGVQLLAGLMLSGVVATKVEGLPFAVAAAFLFVLARPEATRPAWKSLARLLAPAAIALSAWFAFGATRGLFFGYRGDGGFLDLHPDHLPVILRSLARAFFSTGYGLPWLVPLACLLAVLPLSRRAVLPLGVAAALSGFFLFTYLHRAEDPTLWISWSAARIFSPVAMLFALAATCARPASGAPATRTPGPTPG